MSKEENIPDPFNVIFSPALYYQIKYNHVTKIRDEDIPTEELKEFERFKSLFKDFLNKVNKQEKTAASTLSMLMTMWGYSRKYCGMCGIPIIGKPDYVGNRIVCKGCYESYKITEELYKREETRENKFPNQNKKNNKTKNNNKNEEGYCEETEE
jgi:NADH pyrophosphatase NudC (nudix superfamily)